MKKRVKYILFAVVALLIVIAVIYSYMQPLKIALYTVELKQAELRFTEQGHVVNSDVLDIFPLVSGEVLEISVAEGDMVKQGDVICTIDSSPLEIEKMQIASTIQGYRAQMANLDLEEKKAKDNLTYTKKQLQSEMDALTAQQHSGKFLLEEQLRLQNIIIEQSEKDVKTAQADYEKAKTLFESGIIARAELENAEKLVSQAETALASNRQQLAVIEQGGSSNDYYAAAKSALEAQIQNIDHSLSQSYTGAMEEYYQALIENSQGMIALLDKQIENSLITAPIAGEITALPVKHSNIVAPAAAVARIRSQEERQTVEVYVSTKDIPSIAVNDQVELTLKQQGEDIIFPGTVTEIGREAISHMSSLGLEERRVKVSVEPIAAGEISGAGGASVMLLPGFDLDVSFITYSEQALTVPKTAVYKDVDTDKDVVLVVGENGLSAKRQVEKGKELRTEYVIVSGLDVGDRVIKDVTDEGVKEGARIEIR